MFGNPVSGENGNPTKRLGTLEEIMSEKKIIVAEDVYGGILERELGSDGAECRRRQRKSF
jgi:hypothetical protein